MLMILMGQGIKVLNQNSITMITDDSSCQVMDIYFLLIIYYFKHTMASFLMLWIVQYKFDVSKARAGDLMLAKKSVGIHCEAELICFQPQSGSLMLHLVRSMPSTVAFDFICLCKHSKGISQD